MPTYFYKGMDGKYSKLRYLPSANFEYSMQNLEVKKYCTEATIREKKVM